MWFGWFKKTEPKIVEHKFNIGDFVIIIPPWLDDTRLVQITGYTDFGPVVSDNAPAIGHTMLYSPVAWEALQSLTPLQRLALFSESLQPIHVTDYTLNYNRPAKCTVDDGVKELADAWYLQQPINQIELIEGREQITITLKAPQKRRRLKRQATPKRQKPTRVVTNEPNI